MLKDLDGEESINSEPITNLFGVADAGFNDIAAAEWFDESVAAGVENKESKA